eukprot:TRINITY_DN33450_c0_g1_i1.p1 TRINITY_DN33450_c0_g1~~TRINITY_DN33450_c0_g1_i1.p1  ORF type:complete len:255 (-),score=73.80 TRINITY_DN33450_c0_g1_i1:68-832(-)
MAGGGRCYLHGGPAAASLGGGPASRSVALGRLLEELEALSAEEVWNVRMFAGFRRVVADERKRQREEEAVAAASSTAPVGAEPSSCLLTRVMREETGLLDALLCLLDARAMATLGASRRSWRQLSNWYERWFLLGMQDFGQQRRLVPPGRFERFDEVMLDSEIDWQTRYAQFVMASRCTSMQSLREAAVRVAKSLDLENSGVEEVRRRLAAELGLSTDFLSVESVEWLLEEASSLSSLGGSRLLPPEEDEGWDG